MAKYLIQDIIPKEKKHAKTTAPVTHHRAKTTHEHAIHLEKPRPTVTHEEPIMHEVLETPPEDPRTIISREIENAEVYTPPATTFATHKEIAVEPTSRDGAWPYNSSRTTDNSTFVHKFDTDDGDRSIWKSWIPWIAIPGIIAVLAAVGLNIFSKSTVLIIPKKDLIPMDQQVTAYKTPAEGTLGFAVMQLAANETREVAATGEKAVTAKATGRIIVYNEQTSAQRLIKNTRFQSPTGKIYRINESINVPKATVKSGKTTPGSIEVTVYADEAGPEYNSEPVDFTVPGLKGSPIYDKVYARSKGPLAGGASGTIKSVSDQDLKQAGEDLRIQLETALRTKARGGLAPSQIAFDGGILLKLTPASLSKDPASSPDKAVVASNGEIYVVTFDRDALTKAIMKTLIPTYEGEPVVIKNLDSLTLAMNKMTADELWEKEELEFVFKGTPEIEWVVNKDVITKALVGSPKDNFNATMSQFQNIERAKANVQPRWKSVFPEDATKISVEIVDSIPR